MSNQPVDYDLACLAKTLCNESGQSGKPYDQLRMPSQAITTAKSVILYDGESGREERWKRFIRIDQEGAIEYCESPGVARIYYAGTQPENLGPPFRVFLYIQAVGLVCNFLFAAKRILRLGNYEAGIRYLVNFVGAKETLLVQFSNREGVNNTRWRDPFDIEARMTGSLSNLTCRDSNLQFEFQISLGSAGESTCKTLMLDCAKRLGLAYNHQSSPRCFNNGTDIFPWDQFDPHPR